MINRHRQPPRRSDFSRDHCPTKARTSTKDAPKKPKNKQTGFTLLELLVALAVFTIIAAAAYSTLIISSQHGQRIQDRLQKLNALETTLDLLQEDILQILDRKTRDELGDHQASLIINSSDGTLLKMTRSGRTNPGLVLPRSELGRVQYRIEDGVLIRDLWRELDRIQNGHRYSVDLMKGIKGMRIRVMDHHGQWQDSWPPPGDPDPERPRGLEFELDTETWGAISRVVPLS